MLHIPDGHTPVFKTGAIIIIESRKNFPREKWSSENWSPKKWSPENWSLENWFPEKWSPENWSAKTQKQKSVVSVEQRGVCVCVCVWNVQMWSIYENLKLDNKPSWAPLVFDNLVHVGSWDERQTSFCVCSGINRNRKNKKNRLNFIAFLWRRTIFEGHFFGNQFSGDYFSADQFSGTIFPGTNFSAYLIIVCVHSVFSKTSATYY